MRVFTLNIHKGFSPLKRRFILPRLREAIRLTGADLVLLQETVGADDAMAALHPSWPEVSQYEYLADELWPTFAYGQNSVTTSGHHGNAVLSSYPIRAWGNIDVSADGDEPRALLHCTIAMPTMDLHVICVHFGLKEAHRRMQLSALCQFVEQAIPAQAPLIVAGDFNDWRGLAHRILRKKVGLREVMVEHFGQAARTFPARRPLLRLDRIYTRSVQLSVPADIPLAGWSHLSDHLPLMAEIEP